MKINLLPPDFQTLMIEKTVLSGEINAYSDAMSLTEQMTELAKKAKNASRQLATLTSQEKNDCLLAMADAIETSAETILSANAEDMKVAAGMGLTKAMLERLELNDNKIAAMAGGVREVAALPDPVGKLVDERTRPNGLKLRKITSPLGAVVIIYESRPNVTADAASLCFKAGSATILRGGKEALNSNRTIAQVMVDAARKVVSIFPEHAIQVVPTTDRAAIPELLSLTNYIDLCMPRGGEGLIRAVTECSKVPVIKHYKGVCHVYVAEGADEKMAVDIAVNSKCQRPSVCNAAETLLVDRSIAESFLPAVYPGLAEHNVELRADAGALAILKSKLNNPTTTIKAASDEDWETEYNDYVLNVKIVDGLDGAIEHINNHGSGHSDSIVTSNEACAQKFLQEVDSAAVYWNASTRFTDGGEFGMGAEIGISTDKIGARGPMGLDELVTYKWHCIGSGQLR
jgi:glutamate-5-semialdehyde dehydrogenase